VKKIIVFSTDFLPHIGGAELAIREIAERITDTTFHVLTARFDGALPSREMIGKITVHRVGFGFSFDKFLLPIFGLVKAVRLHRREKFDASWCMMASHASIAAAFFKIFRRRIPLVLTLQEGDEEEHLLRYTKGNKFLYKILIRPWHQLIFLVTDSITVISKHLESRARKNNCTTPIVIIPNGVAIADFDTTKHPEWRIQMRRAFNFADADFVTITVSRLVLKNRVEDCIRALSDLPPSYKLLIVGSGPLQKELEGIAHELGVSPRVVFAGSVIPSEVPRFLSAADAFVRPSASEGFGSAFIEAMAARVPVIATAIGGIVDFLEDKKTGLFCEVENPKDVARKINVLARDFALRGLIVEEAYALVRQKYDWSAIAARMQVEAFVPLFALRKERILIATGIYPPDVGGPAIYAQELTRAFQERGHVSSVSVFGPRKLPSGLRHIVYFFRLLIPVFLADWVIILDTLSAGVPATLAAKIFRRVSLMRVGGDFVWEQYIERTDARIPLPLFYNTSIQLNRKERLALFLTRWSLKHVHRVVFTTEWQRNIWMQPYRLSSAHTAVVENFYGEKLPAVTPVRKNFVWAGRDIRLKNVTALKEAFAAAKKQIPDLELSLLSLPHDALLVELSRAYAVVVPTLSEVSPNLIMEVIRFGKPFILTEHNGISDRVRDLGILIDPLKTEDITEAIVTLADGRHYSKYDRNLKAFSFVHNWGHIAEEYSKVFTSL